ncbi:MAG: hypothetical protein J7513_07835, partial [Solirubrobacteraceae bacterium]|nr:hypothetical protein [Solirubrobacteraceae bacterium]
MSLPTTTTDLATMSRRPTLIRAFGRRLAAALPLAAVTAALAPAASHAAVTATSAQPVFPDTLVFSRYHHIIPTKTLADGTTIPWPETVPIDTGIVNVTNTGDSPVSITSASIAAPSSFKVLSPTSFPAAIAPGATLPVQVQFTYNTNATSPNHQLVSSTLTINTNDASSPSKTIKLRGWWQTRPEGGTEPGLRDIVNNIYGFKTSVPSGSQLQQNGGSTKPVGPETVSAYWKRLDTTKPVRVVQLVAYHGSGKTESIFWGSKSAPKFIAKHGPKYAQTVLPMLDPANTAPLDVSRTPTVEPFAFGV